MFKTMQKHGVALALFAALFTGLTALVNELTKPTIARQSALQQKMLFDQVIADDVYDNPIQDSCLAGEGFPARQRRPTYLRGA